MLKKEGSTNEMRPKTLIQSQRRIIYILMEPQVPRKENKFKRTRCPYYMRGFHLASQYMKKTIDQISTLLEHNNISLPQGEKKSNAGQLTEDHERCHALKESLTQSKAYLIDSGASNYMVSSKESFSTITIRRTYHSHGR